MGKSLKKQIKHLKGKDEYLVKKIADRFDEWISDLPFINSNNRELTEISKEFSEKYLKAYRAFTDYTLLEKIYYFLENADIVNAQNLLKDKKLYTNSLEHEVNDFINKLKEVEKDENFDYLMDYAEIAEAYEYEDLVEHYDLLRLKKIEQKQEKIVADKLKTKLEKVNAYITSKKYQQAQELIIRIRDIIADAKVKFSDIITYNLNSISADCLCAETTIKRNEKNDKIDVKSLILKENFNEALITYYNIEWVDDISSLGDLASELSSCSVQSPEKYAMYSDIAKEYEFNGIASVFGKKYERLINAQMKKTK